MSLSGVDRFLCVRNGVMASVAGKQDILLLKGSMDDWSDCIGLPVKRASFTLTTEDRPVV